MDGWKMTFPWQKANQTLRWFQGVYTLHENASEKKQKTTFKKRRTHWLGEYLDIESPDNKF